MGDGTVGLKQSASPDRLLDNETVERGDDTVYRQRVVTFDVYTGGEILPDQSGSDEVLEFVFTTPVDMVWVRSDGADVRVDPFGGEPDASTGIKAEDGLPTPLTVRTSTVKVFVPAAVTTSVNVYGYRYEAPA